MSHTRSRFAGALLIAIPAIVLSAFVVLPPWSMGGLVVAVGASELSPLLAILDVLALLLVVPLLRGRRRMQLAVGVLLVAAAAVSVRPLLQYRTVARSASVQLGRAEAIPRFSLVAALRGPSPTPHVRERVVAYRAADGSPLTMRLYSHAGTLPRPVVVVVYGGAWRSGTPAQAEPVSRMLAQQGFAVAAVDYRHAPRARFPAQLDDVRAALALLRDSSAAWKLDTARVALLGRSSGGELAELAAFTPGPLHVRALVAVYAPFDLVRGYRELPRPDPIGVRAVLRDYLGGAPHEQPARYREASPSSHVSAQLPPTLLVYGARDHVVKPEFNRGAADALRRAGIPVVAVELPWAEHGFDLGPAGLGGQLAAAAIRVFLGGRLGVATP